MPTDYQLWATQATRCSDAQLVQVLEFKHPHWGSIFVSDYGIPFAGTTEAAVAFTATEVSFVVELPVSSPTTQQELIIKMDALGGLIMSNIRALSDTERQTPITVVYRVYIDRDAAAPCLDPSTFIILNASGTRLVVQFTCAATVLPNVSAGTRYTMEDFPTMAYL